MAEPEEPFEYSGGFGIGPAGSTPAGSAFTDENVGPARPDIPGPAFTFQDYPLIIETDE